MLISTSFSRSLTGIALIGSITFIGAAPVAQAAEDPSVITSLDWETGDIESGQPGQIATAAENVKSYPQASPDLERIATDNVRYGAFADLHQTVTGDSGYVGTGQIRSESSSRAGAPTQATIPTFRSYQVSFSLVDWEYWLGNDPDKVAAGVDGYYSSSLRDVVWQFKRGSASPVEAYFAIRGNALQFTYGNGSDHHTIIPDLRLYDRDWIDLRIDVEWREDATGSYVVGLRLPGEADYSIVIEMRDVKTWKSDVGGDDNGVYQWGDFRPNARNNSTGVVAPNAPSIRQIMHDNIRVSTQSLPAPSIPTKPQVTDETVNTAFGQSVTLAAASDDTTVASAVILPEETTFFHEGAANGGKRIDIPGEGSWTLQESGAATFNPLVGFVGITTRVRYVLRASDGGGAVGTLQTTVRPGPSAQSDQATAIAGHQTVIDPLSNDVAGLRPDGTLGSWDRSSLTLSPIRDKHVSVAGEGNYEVREDGTLNFIPEAGFTGITTPLAYRAMDEFGNAAESSVIFTVDGVTATTSPGATELGPAPSASSLTPSGGGQDPSLRAKALARTGVDGTILIVAMAAGLALVGTFLLAVGRRRLSSHL